MKGKIQNARMSFAGESKLGRVGFAVDPIFDNHGALLSLEIVGVIGGMAGSQGLRLVRMLSERCKGMSAEDWRKGKAVLHWEYVAYREGIHPDFNPPAPPVADTEEDSAKSESAVSYEGVFKFRDQLHTENNLLVGAPAWAQILTDSNADNPFSAFLSEVKPDCEIEIVVTLRALSAQKATLVAAQEGEK